MNSDSMPNWASWFQKFSAAVCDFELAEIGEKQTHVVISVPTGQYAVWMIASGAFQATSTNAQVPEVGVRYAGWFPPKKRMDDIRFNHSNKSTYLEFDADPQSKVEADMERPLKVIPDGTPEDRAGQGVGRDIKKALSKIEGMKLSWTMTYADQCLSPVVIIGTGREYLHNQRMELQEKVPEWMDEMSLALLSEDSQQTSNPDRMYFHPFMVFAPGVGNQRKWLRQMTPKVVVCTSWSAYEQLHDSLFVQSPFIVLANRRVEKSLLAANYVQDLEQDPRVTELLKRYPPPRSIHVRSFLKPVFSDTGDIDDQDDLDELVEI